MTGEWWLENVRKEAEVVSVTKEKRKEKEEEEGEEEEKDEARWGSTCYSHTGED